MHQLKSPPSPFKPHFIQRAKRNLWHDNQLGTHCLDLDLNDQNTRRYFRRNVPGPTRFI